MLILRNSNADNCLRGLQNHPTLASPFCGTYTTAVVTAVTGLPTFLSGCRSSSSRISSACSCFGTQTTGTLQSSTTIGASSSSLLSSISSLPTLTTTISSSCTADPITVTTTQYITLPPTNIYVTTISINYSTDIIVESDLSIETEYSTIVSVSEAAETVTDP